MIGEPIPVEGYPDDETAARRLRREVEGALHELIEDELARRAGFADVIAERLSGEAAVPAPLSRSA